MRKRYKLIKDLPTCSAGQEFYIGREDAVWEAFLGKVEQAKNDLARRMRAEWRKK